MRFSPTERMFSAPHYSTSFGFPRDDDLDDVWWYGHMPMASERAKGQQNTERGQRIQPKPSLRGNEKRLSLVHARLSE